jgi:predicted transcriptional regulator
LPKYFLISPTIVQFIFEVKYPSVHAMRGVGKGKGGRETIFNRCNIVKSGKDFTEITLSMRVIWRKLCFSLLHSLSR